MSSRIVPLAALSVMLLVIFWAVVATAQQPGAAPVEGQFLPIQPGDLQPGVQQPQFGQLVPGQVGPVQPGLMQPGYPQPLVPFQLNPQEEQYVDRVLDDWQGVSVKVKTLEAAFTLYEYNAAFGGDKPIRQTAGKVRYAAPDKGHYETDDKQEKWVCTGTSIFEFNNKLQKVREYKIPPQMQGQAIADGPMPFVFGVDKAKMKHRYWLRVITPAGVNGQVWLEAYPKLAKDAANFQRIEVILKFTLNPDGTVADLQPFGLNLIKTNGQDRSAYVFSGMNTNGTLARIGDWINWFVRPNTPSGWSHEVSDFDAPLEPTAPGQPPAGPPPGASGIGAAPQTVVPR